MAWSGFSEEMIRQMKEEGTRDAMANSKQRSGMKNAAKRGRSSVRRGGILMSTQKSPDLENGSSLLKSEQKLSPVPVSHPENLAWKDLQTTPKKQAVNSIRQKQVPPSAVEEESQPEVKLSESEKEVQLKILDEEEGKERELSKLEKLQEQQKQIEEDNKKKKAQLFQALENRKKKTQEESKRLAFVQKELSKIENLLTSDVKILRDKIEDASRQYTEAERRYQNAEKEFVAAKMNLHRMEEKKEALTEHLFTIIHQNELRKAKKLEELVTSLDASEIDLMPEEPHPSNLLIDNHALTSTTSSGGPDDTSDKTEKLETDGSKKSVDNSINTTHNEGMESQERVDSKDLNAKCEESSKISSENHEMKNISVSNELNTSQIEDSTKS